MMATFCSISMYALAEYVPKCDQETITATKVDDTGLSRRVTSPPRIDLHAISIARGTREQDQRRIQGQHPAGVNHRRAKNETTPRGHRSADAELDWKHAPLVAWNHRSWIRRSVRKIFRGRKTFPS